MENVTRGVEKSLADAKKLLFRGKITAEEYSKLFEQLGDIVRMSQYFNGVTFHNVFHEVLREFFKSMTGDMAVNTSVVQELVQELASAEPIPSVAKGADTIVTAAVAVASAPVALPTPVTATAPLAAPVNTVSLGPVVPVPPADDWKEKPRRNVFQCKQCRTRHDHMPLTGKCECGNGSFTVLDVPVSSEEHKELCRDLEKELAAPPVKSSPAPVAASVLPVADKSTASVAEVLDSQSKSSGVLSVLNREYWACDNSECGSDDLLHEVPVPPPDKKQIASRYQCLKCGYVGQILLQYDELVALRGSSLSVAYKIGKDDYKLLVAWRDAPAPSETAVKAPEAQKPAAPALMTAEPAAPPVKKTRGRPRKGQEVTAPQPESFQGKGNESVGEKAAAGRGPAHDKIIGGSAEAGAGKAAQAVPSVADLVAKIAGYEAPQVNPEAIKAATFAQVADWTMAKLISSFEELTGQVFDQSKIVVPSDKNIREVLEEAVVAQLVGRNCGVEA
jgi:hypothetical protein